VDLVIPRAHRHRRSRLLIPARRELLADFVERELHSCDELGIVVDRRGLGARELREGGEAHTRDQAADGVCLLEEANDAITHPFPGERPVTSGLKRYGRGTGRAGAYLQPRSSCALSPFRFRPTSQSARGVLVGHGSRGVTHVRRGGAEDRERGASSRGGTSRRPASP
jgi:hypothetical protein